jgi:hypothetical protein
VNEAAFIKDKANMCHLVGPKLVAAAKENKIARLQARVAQITFGGNLA